MSLTPRDTFLLGPSRWRANGSVNASMSASHLADTYLSGSFRNSRGGPFVLKFHSEWLHRKCPTHMWYEAQRLHGQQNGSSTCFKSVQHRRTREAPFFHEFLLLYLADGSIYRIERTGVGSNTDAIRPGGCCAQDLIQWFTAQDYAAVISNKPSDLIWEVRFPREFDILEVLAICYSIHQCPQARMYTLQRYNCYFFCCTILSVLSRRTAAWETLISADFWDSLLSEALSRLTRSLESTDTPESKRHIVPRLLSMLGSNPDQSMRLLVEALRNEMSLEAGGYQSFVGAFASTTWWSDVAASLAANFRSRIHEATLQAQTQDAPCATVFDYKRHTFAHEVKGETLNGRAAQIFRAEHLIKTTAFMDFKRNASFEARRREQHLSLATHTLALTCGTPLGVARAVAKMCCKKRREWGRGIPWSTRMNFAVAWGRTIGPQIILAWIARQQFTSLDWVIKSEFEADISLLEIPALEAALDVIEKSPYQPEDVHMALSQCFASFMEEAQAEWGQKMVGPLLFPAFEEAMERASNLKGGQIEVSTKESYDPSSATPMNVRTFQEHIKNHIQTYAARVDAYGLSVAQFVVRDVEAAIGEIWKSMPKDFGACV